MQKTIRRLWLRVNLLFQAERERPIRAKFCRKLTDLSGFITSYGLAGGIFNEKGEFYLRTYDGLHLFYNFSDGRYTIGDGQGLDLRPVKSTQPLEDFLMRCLNDEMVYFDVGANNGYYYSLKVAKRFSGCRVYSFEADPRILYHLKKNIKTNGVENVTVVPQALSNFIGVAKMTAYLGASNYLITADLNSVSVIEVNCITLDAFVKQNAVPRIDVIKVDIEGAEHRFLEGSKATLRKFRPVMILELNPDLLHRSGASLVAVKSILAEVGYRCLRVSASNDAIAIPEEKINLVRDSDYVWLESL